MRTDILEREEEIRFWISQHQSKAFICEKLRCKPLTLEDYLKKMSIEYSGNQGSKGKNSPFKKNSSEYLSSGSFIKAHTLRLKLLEDGIKEKKCEICLLSMWNGRLIPLELHHIDGNRFNNCLENLQILCPNCHAQTSNNCGKNIGKYASVM